MAVERFVRTAGASAVRTPGATRVTDQSQQRTGKWSGSIGRTIGYWQHRAGIRTGTDFAGTETRIRDGARLAAGDLWLVACSAVLASIGLDLDSGAVIIGAMLISPLMGPILATGLALGISDRTLLSRSARELGLATCAALALSTVYFWLSPLAQPTTQIVSRIHPTLLDVGIALFGGVAGIVAGSRRVPSLALPGVAIATALMPPLGVAGFGLATGRLSFFFGALYLFLLNGIFIALATFLVVRYLKFPEKSFVDAGARRRAHRVIATTIVIAAAPSLYFLYKTAAETREHQRVESFLHDMVRGPDRDVIRWDLVPAAHGQVLKVYVTGSPIEPDSMSALSKQLPLRGLSDIDLQIVQSQLSASDVAQLRADAVQGVLQAMAKSPLVRDSVRDSVRNVTATRNARIGQASREMAIAFPEIERIAFATLPDALAKPGEREAPALLIAFRRGTSRPVAQRVLERAAAFLRARLPADTIRVQVR